MKKKLLGAFMAVAALGALAACSRPVPEPEAGEFTATAQGWNDWVGVELVIENGVIVDVIVDWNNEDQPWVDMIYPGIRQEVIDRQGTAGIVASGTGATSSANAFLNAVNEVLERHNIGEIGEVEEPVAVDPDDFVPSFGFGDNVEVVTGWAYSPDPRGAGMTEQGNQPIAVQVNFAPGNERIDSINVDFNMETEMFVNFMHPMVVDQIISQQSTEGIDVSNGATVTSTAVVNAVQAVLDRVGFVTPEIEEDEDEIVEYDEDEDEDVEVDEPAVDEPQAPADEPTPPVVDEPAAPTGRFTPGTFTGTSNNTYSHNPNNEGGLSPTPLVVQITVDDNNITAATVLSHGETAMWVNNFAAPAIQYILDNQRAMTSTVSGATYTSRAINEAAAAAINAATR